MLLRLKIFFWKKPRWWQVYAEAQDSLSVRIVCEHRYLRIAELCVGLKSARGRWHYNIQCRAGCRECEPNKEK